MTDLSATTPYEDLGPELILDAVDASGWSTDGTLLALNSYENRVYQVGVSDHSPLIAKFYRPGRWSDAAIGEEHAFLLQLDEREIPAVPPLRGDDGVTLRRFGGYRFALFPRRGGRAPDLEIAEHLVWLGRFLGRIHAVGASSRFRYRPQVDIATLGESARETILTCQFMPAELIPRYSEVSALLLEACRRAFARSGAPRVIRLHGDCHPGNILWTDAGPHFVDFDDCATGPAIQDLWMLLSGSRDDMTRQLAHLLEGYEQFHSFDPVELHLVEALRSLRMMNYAAWLARRWADPAFPRSFPWFNTARYWEDHIQSLREQVPLVDEPPLGV